MTYRCVPIAVPRAPFESMQLQQFANGAKVYFPRRLITGKSLMPVAIVNRERL